MKYLRQFGILLLISPKSMTTAIGMDISAELGGYVSITVIGASVFAQFL